jgi:hypothetical protein
LNSFAKFSQDLIAGNKRQPALPAKSVSLILKAFDFLFGQSPK